MALQRNGHVHKTKKSKFKRNGNGTPDHEPQSVVYKGKTYLLSNEELRILQREDNRIVKWLAELNKFNDFSREWILTCLQELTLQCMGKLPHALGDMHVTSFMPGTAKSALKLMAEIQGYNIWKLTKDGVITPAFQAVQNENGEQGTIGYDGEPRQLEDLRTNDEITAEVLDILTQTGSLKSQAERIIEAEVVEVHTT